MLLSSVSPYEIGRHWRLSRVFSLPAVETMRCGDGTAGACVRFPFGLPNLFVACGLCGAYGQCPAGKEQGWQKDDFIFSDRMADQNRIGLCLRTSEEAGAEDQDFPFHVFSYSNGFLGMQHGAKHLLSNGHGF